MSENPNVVVITTHDSGRHFGCYGVETVQSPEIDQLASDGYRFTNYFAAVPQCSPSRAAMLTGQYPQTNGVLGLTSGQWQWSLEAPRDHLSWRLRDAGYRTALFGFQHEVLDGAELGFDERYIDSNRAADVAPTFAEFVAGLEDDETPFYAQIGLHETHRPLASGAAEPDDEDGVSIPPYIADNETAREEFANLEGSVREADRAVGAIREALRDAGLEEETILVFTSDHGISFSRAKGYLYDAGIGIPLVVHWPDGDIEGGEVCDWLLSNVDFVPTLMDLLDESAPNTDGTSFAGAFGDGEGDPPRDAVYALFHDHAHWGFGPHARCVRTADHKLIRNFTPDPAFDPPLELGDWDQLGRDGLTSEYRPVVELYDLEDDPNEFDNRAEDPEYAEVREQLDDSLWNWMEAVEDSVLTGRPLSPYYDRAMADYPGDTKESSGTR